MTISVRNQRALARGCSFMMKALTEHVGSVVRLSEADQVRTLRWLTWSRRHGVLIAFIIDRAFAWGTAVASTRIKRRATVLPVGIPAMTGDMCRDYIAEHLYEHFPSNQSTVSLRLTMLSGEMEGKLTPSATGGLLDYESVEDYTEAYELAIRA